MFHFCRVMRCIKLSKCISAAYAVMQCLCVCVCVCVCVTVCVSVTFVSCVKTNKDIFEIFSPSGSHTILVFPYQTWWRYSYGNPPNGGVECRWGRQKSRFWAYIYACCWCWNRRGVVNMVAGGRRPPSRKLWHLYRWSAGTTTKRHMR